MINTDADVKSEYTKCQLRISGTYNQVRFRESWLDDSGTGIVSTPLSRLLSLSYIMLVLALIAP